MTLNIRTNDEWKEIDSIYIKKNDAWLNIEKGYIKKDDDWKLFFEKAGGVNLFVVGLF